MVAQKEEEWAISDTNQNKELYIRRILTQAHRSLSSPLK